MKKAIVTGSTGFIGSYFVRYLLDKGVDVLALGRKDFQLVDSPRRLLLEGSTYINLTMEMISSLPQKIDNVRWNVGDDCVFFNLAWSGCDRLSDLNIAAQLNNVSDSVNALEASAVLGCVKFVQIGSMEEAFTLKYLDLDHRSDCFYNRHVIYSIAKIAAKNALSIKASQLDIKYVYVLHSHVMGPNDDKDSFLQMTLVKLIKNETLIFSTGEQTFDVVSLSDCSQGYYCIGKDGLPGKSYWVGSGDPQPLRKYVERMYSLFPSTQPMQFGMLPYNDIILSEATFSIDTLVHDTGFTPLDSYEATVSQLHKHLSSILLSF